MRYQLDFLYWWKCCSEESGRQLNVDPLYAYLGWGFVAGILDYFVRYGIDLQQYFSCSKESETKNRKIFVR